MQGQRKLWKFGGWISSNCIRWPFNEIFLLQLNCSSQNLKYEVSKFLSKRLPNDNLKNHIGVPPGVPLSLWSSLFFTFMLDAPGNWTYISEKFYYSSNEGHYYNFQEAKEHCGKSGGKLAEPQNISVNLAITNHFNGFLFMNHWIGIRSGLNLESKFPIWSKNVQKKNCTSTFLHQMSATNPESTNLYNIIIKSQNLYNIHKFRMGCYIWW